MAPRSDLGRASALILAGGVKGEQGIVFLVDSFTRQGFRLIAGTMAIRLE
jgi:hypothetical protein